MRSAQAVIGIQCGVGTVDGVMRRIEIIDLAGYFGDALCGEDCLRVDRVSIGTRRHPPCRRGCYLKIDRFHGVKNVLIAGVRFLSL